MPKNTVAFRLKSLNNQIRRMFDKQSIRDNPDGLTGMHYAVIGFVAGKAPGEDVYQRDIEAEFNIRRPTATGILQLMEKNGLLRRESVASDARLKRIVLTDKALEMDREGEKNMRAMDARLRKGISDEDMATFFRVTDQIAENLK